jgi:hypothetical protein
MLLVLSLFRTQAPVLGRELLHLQKPFFNSNQREIRHLANAAWLLHTNVFR